MTSKQAYVHHLSPNHDIRRIAGVDMLVLHYTGMRSGPEALDRLLDPDAQVSAHYLVDEDGTIHHLVPESRRAWHAGKSCWRGETDVNSRSIGVEIVNPGHEFGYRPFPEVQIQAVIRLCLGIVSRHSITARNVVGHSDVAPTRKQDPGELFPWAQLKGYGLGLWPFTGDERAVPEPEAVPGLLAAYGYDVSDPAAAIAAFQRHFRPERIDGVADGETLARLQRLLAAV
ncbi:N-acetylmuramoyl-L-alanine amidase [Magnetospirillum aberrantis]|uniref:N-acetylmuramoyl-L-alanine amidase n=1 Tax=Magnetospirillum aberrantis SpK TaxID=908842 RepID=A0A7C9QVW8_9PROT|nr:N-acetylmuramoyl-L-alanine amidase [Magnetospirillum aberrantis]NFV81441.1 N-acetylmuramoyl-L-alanine amidase [Magnetospirillum aberrantis SpK]